MNIIVTKITSDSLIGLAMSYTKKKTVILTNKNKDQMYKAEHSPIRTQIFAIQMNDIPSYVSVHFCRHKVGVEHFVSSNRDKTQVITRDSLVDHLMILNAQALMNIARKRLCYKADKVTREIMEGIKNSLKKTDETLYKYLTPTCYYRNECPEPKSCGLWKKEKENKHDK